MKKVVPKITINQKTMLHTMEETIGDMKDVINIGVDIDGTLTDEKIDLDMLYLSPRDVERKMLSLGPKDGIDVLFDTDHNIYPVTGRQERYRGVTEDWLDTYGIPYIDLTMFPDNFYVKNGYDVPRYVCLKLDIHIRKNLQMSLDDNEDVVIAFNKAGIPTCKVDNNFRDAFEKVLELKNNKDNIQR